jgi:hypothetical protein
MNWAIHGKRGLASQLRRHILERQRPRRHGVERNFACPSFKIAGGLFLQLVLQASNL